MNDATADTGTSSVPPDRWRRGNTYVGRRDGLLHLYVILTDPEPETGEVAVAVVSVETYTDDRHDDSCILRPGDGHPFIRHMSYVSFRRARVAAVSEAEQEVERFREPMPDAAMDKIYRGAERTRQLPADVRTILIRQGLIEY